MSNLQRIGYVFLAKPYNSPVLQFFIELNNSNKIVYKTIIFYTNHYLRLSGLFN